MLSLPFNDTSDLFPSKKNMHVIPTPMPVT